MYSIGYSRCRSTFISVVNLRRVVNTAVYFIAMRDLERLKTQLVIHRFLGPFIALEPPVFVRVRAWCP